MAPNWPTTLKVPLSGGKRQHPPPPRGTDEQPKGKTAKCAGKTDLAPKTEILSGAFALLRHASIACISRRQMVCLRQQ